MEPISFLNPISGESARAYLLLLDSGSADAKQVGMKTLIPERGLLVGTDALADVQIFGLSKQEACHVRIWREPGESWQFRQLEDSLSVLINGVSHHFGLLRDGDLIQVGHTIFEFLLEMGPRYRAYLEMDARIRIDQLTKLHNRKSILEHIEREMSRLSRQKNDIFSIVLFNLDHFAEINSVYGYFIGDEVLRTVAKRLEQSLRKHELVGRYGGEEFLVLLPGVGEHQVFSLSEMLRTRVQQHPVFCGGHDILITLSGGGITATEAVSFQSLLQRAEDRLSLAKEMGRNRIIFTDTLEPSDEASLS